MNNKGRKIACMANMNNNMFSLVRYLRDKGYDAHLFLVEEFDHFLPKCDTYNDEYKEYTHQLDWYEIGQWRIKKDKIIQDVDGFDFFICCDRIPQYLHKGGIPIDVFIPHGGDVFQLTKYAFQYFPPKKWEIDSKVQAYRQKRAIRNAKTVMYDITNNDAEKYIVNLNLKGKRFVSTPPFIYYPQYYNESFGHHSNTKERAEKLREENDFIVMHQCRHVWKSHVDTLHFKANDVIIKGFADFVKATPNVKSKLIMFEYGWDFEASKELVKELGIENSVIWLPLSDRKDLMIWLSFADIGVGEIGRSWLSYGSVYELLALKIPFVGYREDELYKSHYPNLYPMTSTKTREGIEAAFTDYQVNKTKYIQQGVEAHEWYVRHGVEKPLTEIVSVIENKI